ncbi:MAG: hypothetical protein QXL47_02405 [Candidatus Anstonellales archaeon]
MRKVFFLLFFISLLFSQPPCPGCEELFNAYESGIIAGLVEKNVDIYMYAVYNGERLPVGNATLFIEVYNATGDLYSRCRVFTNENGKAVFDLTPYNETCSGTGMVRGCTIGVKFCCSSSPNCLLQPCLNESITSFEDVSPCGGFKPAPWPESAYINKNGQPIFATLSPTYAQVVYIPTLLPPLFGGTAPAICLPLFIIAGMLLAASYATGGSPFFWFDLNTLRFITGQRARITGKGGITLSQAKLVKFSKERIPGVKKAIEKVSSKITALPTKAGEAVGAWVTKLVRPSVKEGLIRGKPAWILEKMGRVEERLRGVGKGRFWTGKKVKEGGGGGELRAGQQRVAIATGQFGVSQIFSAALMVGFARRNIASLAEFFGVSEAMVEGLMRGAAREQLKYLTENSSELQKLLEGKEVDPKVKEAIYSNLSGLYMALAKAEEDEAKAEAEKAKREAEKAKAEKDKAKAEEHKAKAEEHKAKAEEYEAKAQLYTQLSRAFGLCSELLRTGGDRQFIETILSQTNQAFLLSRTFDPKILKEAEEAKKQLPTVQQGTPEYQDLQAKIDKAKPYEDALSTLQNIGPLLIAWKGNIRIGDDVISLGMNEGELREARTEIAKLYGKDWSELMPATEIERSLYAAYLTKWEGKLPNEKQFEEWKREQISLYERAATVSEQIAAILENKELSEEDKRTQIEEILRKDPEAGEKVVQIVSMPFPLITPLIYSNLKNILAVNFENQGVAHDEAITKAADLVDQAKTDEKAKKQIAPFKPEATAETLFMLESTSPGSALSFLREGVPEARDGYVSSYNSLTQQEAKKRILVGYVAIMTAPAAIKELATQLGIQ